ncbi:glutamine--tRNA ligase [Tanacetum coccineum]|uniref:Glutamine--tRNA ligase n=1 Tax=Tanacetum coccineum TaxID=301880 RepID=A0ABQ5ER90_9ASTR
MNEHEQKSCQFIYVRERPIIRSFMSLEFAEVGDKFQFERHGYFVVDKDSTPEKLIFNRTVALRDTNKPGSIK